MRKKVLGERLGFEGKFLKGGAVGEADSVGEGVLVCPGDVAADEEGRLRWRCEGVSAS